MLYPTNQFKKYIILSFLQLKDIIENTKKDNNIRVGILRSSNPNMFCAGADLKVYI